MLEREVFEFIGDDLALDWQTAWRVDYYSECYGLRSVDFAESVDYFFGSECVGMSTAGGG